MKHFSFPSIGQFRQCIKEVHDSTRYSGRDENNDPIFNPTVPLPTITFGGTVKLHGTNAGVVINFDKDEVYAQSRERVLTIESDNFGFAAFVHKNRELLHGIGQSSYFYANLDKEKHTYTDMVIYGEWAGKGIQKGVAISNVEKSFFIFAICARSENEELWIELPEYPVDPIFAESNIYFIDNYKTYQIDIDFNNPQLIQNQLIEYTNEVEKECPVAKAFGHSGTGEGIVWSADYKGRHFMFKVKGEEHSISKVKTLASVDTEKLNSINEFVTYAVTENRVNQFVQSVFGGKEKFDQTKIGDFLRAFNNDIIKEETDTLVNNGLDWKEVAGAVSRQAKILLFKVVI